MEVPFSNLVLERPNTLSLHVAQKASTTVEVVK
jgi:hypothetical protein